MKSVRADTIWTTVLVKRAFGYRDDQFEYEPFEEAVVYADSSTPPDVEESRKRLAKSVRRLIARAKKEKSRLMFVDRRSGLFTPSQALAAIREYVHDGAGLTPHAYTLEKTAASVPPPERVRIVVPTGRGSYMMEELLYPPMAGKIRFPGGKIEDGEDYRSAAVRELLEETGQKFDPETLEYLGQEGNEHFLLAPRNALASGKFSDAANPGKVIPLRPHRMNNRNYTGVAPAVLYRLLGQRKTASVVDGNPTRPPPPVRRRGF